MPSRRIPRFGNIEEHPRFSSRNRHHLAFANCQLPVSEYQLLEYRSEIAILSLSDRLGFSKPGANDNLANITSKPTLESGMESPAASQHRLVAQPNSPIDAFSSLLAPIHPFMVISSLLVAKGHTMIRRGILMGDEIMNPSAAASLLCYGETCALHACATTLTRPLLTDYLPSGTPISPHCLICIPESPGSKWMHQLMGQAK